MKRTMLFVLVLAIALTTVGSAVFAQDTSAYCTNDPDDGSGLPGCVTPDDNECYVGGVLYRDANQDGCPTTWYWQAGWFLARFLDGDITREQVPAEYHSVLPPPPPADVVVPACQLDLSSRTNPATSQPYGLVAVPQAVLNAEASTKRNYAGPPYYSDGTFNWDWHNGPGTWDLGFDYPSPDVHVYTVGAGWSYPTIGNCAVNTANLP